MTPEENFRFGFLLRCAEEGCSVQEIQDRVKYANVLGTAAGTALKWGIPLTMAAGVVLPAAATLAGTAGVVGAGDRVGKQLAGMTDPNLDPEDIKRQELINAYRLQAEQIRQRAKRQTYRQSKPKAPSLY